MTGLRRVLRLTGWLLGALAGAAALLAGWLYVDAHRERDAWFSARQGELADARVVSSVTRNGELDEEIRLTSSSGLQVRLRLRRPAPAGEPAEALPVLLLLGGQRTGADAVELFGNVDGRAVAALDYPYDGPERIRGVAQTLSALPAIRRLFLDATPAIGLATEWLSRQPWVEPDRLALAGVSLGVPFATTAAARDERLRALLLVHGAADNGAWVRRALELRELPSLLLAPATALGNWLVYGPVHDTAEHVAELSPRPVIVIGARDDERVPAGQTEALYEAAGEPKRLRWTDGRHVQPGRQDIVRELLRIAENELRESFAAVERARTNTAQ